jgi:hypothetical protein
LPLNFHPVLQSFYRKEQQYHGIQMVISKKCPILGVDNVKLFGFRSMKVRQSVAPKMLPFPQCLCKWEKLFLFLKLTQVYWQADMVYSNTDWLNTCRRVSVQSTRSEIENNLFPFHSIRASIWFDFSDCP